MPARFAISGYAGLGRSTTFARMIVGLTRSVVGFGGVGGRGGATVSTTVGGVVSQLTHPGLFEVNDGGSTFRGPIRKLPVTGGTFEAVVPTLSGTRVGSLVVVIAFVLTDS